MSEAHQSPLRLTDFRLAGFLSARRAVLVGTELNGRKEVVFLFENSEGQASSLLNQYPGSAEQSYDAACKAMHDLVKMTLLQRRD